MLILALALQVTTNCQTYGANIYCDTQDYRPQSSVIPQAVPPVDTLYRQLLAPFPLNKPKQSNECLSAAKRASDEGDNETALKILRLCKG